VWLLDIVIVTVSHPPSQRWGSGSLRGSGGCAFVACGFQVSSACQPKSADTEAKHGGRLVGLAGWRLHREWRDVSPRARTSGEAVLHARIA
jgi:hypothetical protein